MKNQRWNKYVFDKWAKKFRTHAQWHNKKENLSLSPSIERTRERNNVKPECIQWEREKTESVNGKEMMKQKCISQKMAKQELGKKRFKTHAYQIDIAIFSKSLGTLLPTQMSSSWSNLHKNSAKLNTLDWNVKPSPLVPQIYVIENGLWKWTKKLKEKKTASKKRKESEIHTEMNLENWSLEWGLDKFIFSCKITFQYLPSDQHATDNKKKHTKTKLNISYKYLKVIVKYDIYLYYIIKNG